MDAAEPPAGRSRRLPDRGPTAVPGWSGRRAHRARRTPGVFPPEPVS